MLGKKLLHLNARAIITKLGGTVDYAAAGEVRQFCLHLRPMLTDETPRGCTITGIRH